MARTTKGRLYQRKRGGDWYLQYYVAGKEIRENLHTTKKREAEKSQGDIVRRLAEGNKAVALRKRADDIDTDVAAGKRRSITIANTWGKYRDSQNRPKSGELTLKDYQSNWRQFTNWYEKEKGKPDDKLSDVTSAVAQEFASSIETNISANRFVKIIRTCKRVFKVTLGVSDNRNPFRYGKDGSGANDGIQLTASEPLTREPFTEDELEKICQTAEGELRTMLAIGFYTALRLGDCATLKWSEVDLEDCRIRRVPNKTRTRHPDKMPPLSIHPVLAGILEETPGDNQGGYVLPKTAALYNRNRPQLSRELKRHFKACGVDTQGSRTGKNAPPKKSFHSLRHTVVSMMGKQGVPLPIVQGLCGHGSPAVQRVYLHVNEDDSRGAVMALPDITGNGATKPKALSAASDDRIQKALVLLEAMDSDNWQGLRDKVAGVLS